MFGHLLTIFFTLPLKRYERFAKLAVNNMHTKQALRQFFLFYSQQPIIHSGNHTLFVYGHSYAKGRTGSILKDSFAGEITLMPHW